MKKKILSIICSVLLLVAVGLMTGCGGSGGSSSSGVSGGAVSGSGE